MQKLTNLEKVKNIFLQKVRQCHYCNNQKLQKHISCCSGKAGFEFSFDNGKLIDYQDHYSNLGDIPFSVYYDFETTTGSMFFCLFVCLFVFFCFFFDVVSYCMITEFHPSIKLPRISIFRSFDQNKNDLESISHFQVIEYEFFNTEKEYFNRTTLKQLQQAAYSVSQKEKNTSLAEMFNIELKFTVDYQKFFSFNLKSHELDLDGKRIFITL